MDVARFKKKPILGILRGIKSEQIGPLIETIVSSGLETIEITMNTEGASSLIRDAVRIAKKRLTIGAGTVLDQKTLQMALDAGATFIVMPVLVKEVVDYCVQNKIPVFPGAFTPQEIYNGWQAGATMIKVFPSGVLGPNYFKELKAPFQNIELMACGGVTPENIREYFSSGASAVAFGASVFRKEWLAKSNFSRVGESIKRFMDAVKL